MLQQKTEAENNALGRIIPNGIDHDQFMEPFKSIKAFHQRLVSGYPTAG
jgi:hypothetical protein